MLTFVGTQQLTYSLCMGLHSSVGRALQRKQRLWIGLKGALILVIICENLIVYHNCVDLRHVNSTNQLSNVKNDIIFTQRF